MLEIEDGLAAYLLDGAVITFGTIVENALQEMVETGSGTNKQRKPRWTLKQVLEPTFKLPRAGEMQPLGKLSGTSDGGMMVDSV